MEKTSKTKIRWLISVKKPLRPILLTQRRPVSYVGTELRKAPLIPSQVGRNVSTQYTYRATDTGSSHAKPEATDRVAQYAEETYRDSRKDSPTPTAKETASSPTGLATPTTLQRAPGQEVQKPKEKQKPTTMTRNKPATPNKPAILTRKGRTHTELASTLEEAEIAQA